jgi:hypothetical protein
MVNYPKYPRTGIPAGYTRVRKPTSENVSPAPSDGMPTMSQMGIEINGGPAEPVDNDPGTPIKVKRYRKHCSACGK